MHAWCSRSLICLVLIALAHASPLGADDCNCDGAQMPLGAPTALGTESAAAPVPAREDGEAPRRPRKKRPASEDSEPPPRRDPRENGEEPPPPPPRERDSIGAAQDDFINGFSGNDPTNRPGTAFDPGMFPGQQPSAEEIRQGVATPRRPRSRGNGGNSGGSHSGGSHTGSTSTHSTGHTKPTTGR